MTLTLNDPSLLRSDAFIAGEWLGADNGARFQVHNPADGSLISYVPNLTEIETNRAIEAAYSAFRVWRSETAENRARILEQWHDLIMSAEDDLAAILCAEQGKPLTEAQGEVAYGASFIKWFAEEAKRAYGDMIPAPSADKRLMVLKQPVGVVGAITPWNFPVAMITRKAAPALAAGCSIITKPAEESPLSALALAVLAERAGVPKGVLSVVPCTRQNAPEIGKALTQNPKVRKLSFTGSTEVGKLLAGQSAVNVQKISLELGGNAPFILFQDADLDAAVEGAIQAKFRNMGQTCVCANRFLVHADISERFERELIKRVSTLSLGPGIDENTDQGPLINSAAVEKVEALISNAVESGAEITCGGRRHSLGGTYFEPTVLRGVNRDMQIVREEIFGPVVAIQTFKTDQEAVALANDTEYGLAAYLFSRDISRVWRIAEALETGMVGINTGAISTAAAPFGGIKQSGLGREGSKYGMDEYLETKYLALGGLSAVF